MIKTISTNKKELFYTVVIFVLFQFMILPSILLNSQYFNFLIIIGLIISIVWVISTYLTDSTFLVSKFSKVMIHNPLREKAFVQLLLAPSLFLVTSLYLNLAIPIYLKLFITVVSTIVYFFLLVQIKKSYKSINSLSHYSKVLFDGVNILFFFLLLNIISEFVQDRVEIVLVVALISGAMFIFNLALNNQIHAPGIIILILSILVMMLSSYGFSFFSFSIFTSLTCVVFYLIITFWHLKLSGHFKFEDYLSPILFGMMASMLILSL